MADRTTPAADAAPAADQAQEQARDQAQDQARDQAQEPSQEQAPDRAPRIGTGPGRLLLWLYGIFTVAALSRAVVQICTKFHHAPLAYVLSAVAGVIYAVILTALVKGGETARRVALVCCAAELLGVIGVGTWTVADSSAFPDQTVWSYYGAGYILLPVLMPVSGLLWLRRAPRERAAGTAGR
jgi:hypothetical protein